MLWMYFPLERGRWDLAWISAGLFGGLAFYSAGFTGLIYFTVPLVFQGRPLNMNRKIHRSSFVAALCILFFFIMLWFVPRWSHEQDVFNFASFSFQTGMWSLIKDFLAFPFQMMLRFFPWILLLWAPFCPALDRLDRNPLFSRYLKRLFIVLFILLWFNPGSASRDFLYLAPLVASMAGLNYWIVVRRYGYRLLGLFAMMAAGILCAIGLCVLYLLLPDSVINQFIALENGIEYRSVMPGKAVALTELGAALFFELAAILIWYRKGRVWLCYSMVFAGMMIVFFSIVNPYRAVDRSKEEMAQDFRESLAVNEGVLPEEVVLYKDSAINGLFSECWYMGCRVQTADLQNIPESPEVVYVLTANIPFGGKRSWSKVHDRLYKDKRLYLYKGVRIRNNEDYDDE